MQKTFFYLIFILFAFSCSNRQEIASADRFFYLIKSKQYSRIPEVLDDSLAAVYTAEEWESLLKKIEKQRGNFIKATAIKVTKQYDANSNLLIFIDYKTRYKHGKYQERVVLIKHPNKPDYKVYQYNFSIKNSEK